MSCCSCGYGRPKQAQTCCAFLLVQIFAISMLALTVVWLKDNFNGFSIGNNAEETENVYILCMVLAIALIGNGILMFRFLREFSAFNVKYVHALFHLLAGVCIALVAFCAVKIQEFSTEPNYQFVSLQSWFGLIVIILFALQLSIGFFTFICRVCGRYVRYKIAGCHAFIGLLIFVFACANTLIAIMDKTDWKNVESHKMPPKVFYGNCAGLSIGGFFAIVIYVALSPNFEWDWRYGYPNCAH